MAEEYINPNIPKNRYIYELQMKDGIVYVRKYPVIYKNKEYVYFKTPGSRRLGVASYVYQNSSEAIPELARRAALVSCKCCVYCWEDPGHTKDDRGKLQKTVTAKKAIAEKLKQAKDALNRVKDMCNDLQKKKEDLQRQVFSLNNELEDLEDIEDIGDDTENT